MRLIELHKCMEEEGHIISSLAFSPKGRILASVAGSPFANSNVHIQLWDSFKLTPVGELKEANQRAGFVAFFPDGEKLASTDISSTGSYIRIWDVEARCQVFEFPAHHLSCYIAISPDGKYIACNGLDRSLKLWDSTTGNLLVEKRLDGLSIEFSPAGKELAVAIESMISIRDSSTLEEKIKLKRHQYRIDCLAYTPDGQVLASGSYNTIKLWNVASGQEIHRLKHGNVRCLSFSPDGSLLVSGGDWEAKIWNWQTGKEVATFPPQLEKPRFSAGELNPPPSGVGILAFHPNGRILAIGAYTSKILTSRPLAGKGTAEFSTLQLWEIRPDA